jgi:hypothetical protein
MSYERLTADNAAVLFIDHQTGLANGVADQSQPEFTSNVTAMGEGRSGVSRQEEAPQ